MTGPEKLRWEEAIVAAFNRQALRRLLLGLDDALEEYEGPNDVVRDIVDKVVAEYVGRGWQNRLLMAVLAARPDNPDVVELARSFGATSVPKRPALESILRQSNSMLDMGVWLEKAVKIQQAVCRIEIPLRSGAKTFGTGFLVGPDLVVTNYHVMEPVVLTEDDPQYAGDRATANQVTCRFDYREMSDGSRSPGSVYRLAAEWRVLLSPNSSLGQEPTIHELDYALLRLAKPAGTLAIGDRPEAPGTERGWIKLQDAGVSPLIRDTPLFIVQHPKAEPIKLALESVSILEVNALRTRVHHRTNTEPGSSGSPCFDQNWNLVALHHSGETRAEPGSNEGIPIDTIVSSMQTHGVPI
jgi:hypothetical protein